MTQNSGHHAFKASNGGGRRRSDRDFGHRSDPVPSRSDAPNWRSVAGNAPNNGGNPGGNSANFHSAPWGTRNPLEPGVGFLDEGDSNSSPHAANNASKESLAHGTNGERNSNRRSEGNCLLSTRESLFKVSYFLVGLPVEVQTKEGNVYRGIFHSIKDDLDVMLNMVRLSRTLSLGEDDELVKEYSRKPPIKTKVFKHDEIVQLIAREVPMGYDSSSNGKYFDDSGYLFTDKRISRGRHKGEERELTPWVPEVEDGKAFNLHLSSDPWGKDVGNGRHWDQFETNRTLFGVESTFDENLYTTRLERPSKEIEMEAARIAREIESENTFNFHLAEERGQVIASHGLEEIDEETRFSSVIRNDEVEADDDEEYTYSNNLNDETFGSREFSSPPRNSAEFFQIKAENSQANEKFVNSSEKSILMSEEESNALLALSEKRTDHLRLRLGNKKGNGTSPYMSPVSKRSPLLSPLVGDAPTIVALNLDHACPQVPEDVYRDFHEFKMSESAKKGKKRENSSLMELKHFSESLRERTPIEPRSPLSRQETPTSRLVQTEFSVRTYNSPEHRQTHPPPSVSDTLHSAAISLSTTVSDSTAQTELLNPSTTFLESASSTAPDSSISPSASNFSGQIKSQSTSLESSEPVYCLTKEESEHVEGLKVEENQDTNQNQAADVSLDSKPSDGAVSEDESKTNVQDKESDSQSTVSSTSTSLSNSSQSKTSTSSLNPNAKEFKLNPNAKVFTPGGSNFHMTSNSLATSAGPVLPTGVPRTFSSGNVPVFIPGAMSPLAISPSLSVPNAMMNQQMILTGPGVVPPHQQGQMGSSPFNTPVAAGFVPQLPPSPGPNFPPANMPIPGNLGQPGMKLSHSSQPPHPHPPPLYQQQQMIPQPFPAHQTIRGFAPNQNGNAFIQQQQQQQQVMFAQNQMVYLQTIPQPFVPQQMPITPQSPNQVPNQKIRGSQGQFAGMQQPQGSNQTYLHGPPNMAHHPPRGHSLAHQGGSGPLPNPNNQHGPNGRGGQGK